MKKTKIIALSFFISVMLIGAGYAAWTDKIGVEGIVKTGNLNVEFVKDADFPFIKSVDSFGKDYTVSSIKQINSKKLRISVSNLYPGAVSYIGSKVKNTGSIPAVIAKVNLNFDNSSDPELKSNLKIAGDFIKISSDNSINNLGSFICNSDNLQTTFAEILNGEVLEPGETIIFDSPQDSSINEKINSETNVYNFESNNCMVFYLPNSVDDTLENKNVQFDLSIDFKQHNQ